MAFQRGDDSDEALLGALLRHEFETTVVRFIEGYVRALSKMPKK